MPNVHFSFRRGAGDVPEILYGKVEIKPTLAFARGTSLVLPAPTTLDLVNGEATANNVYPTPAPVAGQVEWAYRVKAIDTRGQSFEWMVGVPDSTGTVEFTSLPRYFETKPPLFGKGEKGDPGEAATIQIGTTTSGTTPSVTNSGTNQAAILNFVLPKGDKGDRGDGVPAGGTALQYLRKDAAGAVTEWATLDKASVGLSNVDNTSDADKPISNDTQAALDNLLVDGDSRWVQSSKADKMVGTFLEDPESETRIASDALYVNRAVPLYDQSRAFRKKLKLSLPFQFPRWDEAKAIWGKEIYPQGFAVDEATNEVFVIYSGAAQVVAVYDWDTGLFKTAFQLGINNTQTSEGLGISYVGSARYLYARTSITSMGKFAISTLPTFGASLTVLESNNVGMGRTMTKTPTGWLVSAGARRDVWIDLNADFSLRGYVTLPIGLTGGTNASDSATSANTPKIQGVCEHEGRIVCSIGGQQYVNQPTIPYGYQGIRVFTKSGELLSDALIDPVVYADVLEPLLQYRPRIIEAEGVHTAGGKLYSLTVTHGWNESEAAIASIEGVVIMEELCADPDALDFSPGAVSSPSPDLRVMGAFQQPTNPAGYPVNPVSGQQLDSIEKIATYMVDSGQFSFQHYVTASAPIAAPTGATIEPWNVLRVTKATTTTVYVELFGLSGRSLWRCSLSGGVWGWDQPKASAPQPLAITAGTAAYDPMYWKRDGIVEVDGAVSLAGLPAGVYHTVATLGSGHKPLKYQYYTATVANSSVVANIRVTTGGDIEVQLASPTGSNVMLNGVRFRAN